MDSGANNHYALIDHKAVIQSINKTFLSKHKIFLVGNAGKHAVPAKAFCDPAYKHRILPY